MNILLKKEKKRKKEKKSKNGFKLHLSDAKKNKKTFVNFSSFHWSIDNQIQEMQKVPASFMDILLKTALQIPVMMTTVKEIGVELDLKTTNEFLKELSLAGRTNQALNKFRRQMIKPSLLSNFAKLANVAKDSAKLLLANNISVFDSLTKENKPKFFLEDKTNEGFEQRNSNFVPRPKRR